MYRYSRFLALVVLGLASASVSLADMMATTEDGQKVILRPNGTWVLAEDVEGKNEKVAKLTLIKRQEVTNGCRLGFQLENHLPATIRTLVLRYTAYVGDGIEFETVSRGFSYVKPTLDDYEEIQFRGITCDQIASVEVSAARNCHVGDLTKFSSDAGDCLELFRLMPTDIMAITQARPE